MADEESFREKLPSDSHINDLIEKFESGDTALIYGHVAERGDSGEWESFEFEVLSFAGEFETLRYTDADIPEGFDWDDFFDFLDDLAEEYDVDYDNSYGESE